MQKIKVDCDDDHLNTAVDAARTALNRSQSNQDRASYVRQAMDNRYGPAWSCVTGRDFGRWNHYLRSLNDIFLSAI